MTILINTSNFGILKFFTKSTKHNYWYLSCTCITAVIMTLFYNYWSSLGRKVGKKQPDVTEVLFFTEKDALCYDHNEYYTSCNSDNCGLEKLKKLITYIDSASESLDVCVYTITSFKLADAVLRKFREGVKVRVITDASMSFCDGSQISSFRKAGVMVRARQSQFLMHHKFVIIDGRLLINGSFNWTSTATFGNWENVTITTVPEVLIQKYADHFELLWTQLCS